MRSWLRGWVLAALLVALGMLAAPRDAAAFWNECAWHYIGAFDYEYVVEAVATAYVVNPWENPGCYEEYLPWEPDVSVNINLTGPGGSGSGSDQDVGCATAWAVANGAPGWYFFDSYAYVETYWGWTGPSYRSDAIYAQGPPPPPPQLRLFLEVADEPQQFHFSPANPVGTDAAPTFVPGSYRINPADPISVSVPVSTIQQGQLLRVKAAFVSADNPNPATGVASPPHQVDGRVHINIDLSDGIGGSSRLYAERHYLEYSIPLSNESQATLFVDQEILRHVFAIRVELEGTEIPVDVRWPDDVSVQDRTDTGIVTRFAAWQPVQLNPRETVWFRVTLERQNRQRFDEGRYDVVFMVSGFETAIRRADGMPWRGVTNARGRIVRSVTIQRPRNVEEQIAAHRSDSILAILRGDRQMALEALLKATELDPNNRDIRLSLGLAYLGLGRYQEAIPIYESLLAGTARPDPLAARDLAKAYLGVRDEGNAVRLLRLIGVPEGEIRGEIETLRQGLR